MGKKIRITFNINDEIKRELEIYATSQGKSLQELIKEKLKYMINNDISLGNKDEIFLNTREKLIEKYGTLKNAAERVGMNPGMLSNTLYFLETKKNYRPSQSTISKLSELLEK